MAVCKDGAQVASIRDSNTLDGLLEPVDTDVDGRVIGGPEARCRWECLEAGTDMSRRNDGAIGDRRQGCRIPTWAERWV